MRFEMSSAERLRNARRRLDQEGFTGVREGHRLGARPLLLVVTHSQKDVTRAIRIVLDEDPDAEHLS